MSECPTALQYRLTIAGGVNPKGEPNFRVVHGSRCFDTIGDRVVPRYLPSNNWHLTAWIPPEKNPPYGGYEHCYALGTRLDEGLVGKIVDMISASRKFTLAERHRAIMAREEAAERVYDREAFDILDDGVGAFHEHPFVPLPIRKDLESTQHEQRIILTDAD